MSKEYVDISLFGTFCLGLGLAGIIFMTPYAIKDEINKAKQIETKKSNLENKAFVNPDKLTLRVIGDTDNPQTVATYNGKDYLFRVGADRIPYLEIYDTKKTR